MKEIEMLYGDVSKIFHDKIRKFCAPLVSYLDINHFYHFRISNNGRYTCISGLNREVEEYFFAGKNWIDWPLYRNPALFENGLWQMNAIEEESTQKILNDAHNKFNVNYSLTLIQKTNNGIDNYGFALNSKNPIKHMALINELPILRRFIKCYQEEFSRSLLSLNDYTIDLEKLLGVSIFNNAPPSLKHKSQARQQFLKRMRIEIPSSLTKRELDVAKYLVKGYYASQIADELFISKRTVEHHVERIKDKFCCTLKPELIQKIQELESIGYLTF